MTSPKFKYCQVSNCKNHAHGVVCTMHRYRWNTYNAYDLPSHKGEPNYLPDVPFPEGVVRFCKVHGYVKREDAYEVFGKFSANYSYQCKRCAMQSNRRRNFEGMETEADYLALLESQNGVCAICEKQSTKLSNNSKTYKSLCVDHNHDTGKTRGLLCDHCNQGIGHFFDSPELTQKASEYLKAHA